MGSGHDGFNFHRIDRGILCAVGVADPLLRKPDGQRGPLMSWIYGLAALAALVIFVYLIAALFKPENLE
jgi:hypothetical protein